MKAELWTHPAFYSTAVDRIEVMLERPSAGILRLRYAIVGQIDDVLLTAPAAALRANNLWRTTCFEAFLAPAGTSAYREFNFAPSSQWAAYDFVAYRVGMVQAPLPAPPEIAVTRRAGRLDLAVALALDLPDEPCRLGLAAVIEETGGRTSYWALNHPAGAPDFHHHSCFALELPPAPAA